MRFKIGHDCQKIAVNFRLNCESIKTTSYRKQKRQYGDIWAKCETKFEASPEKYEEKNWETLDENLSKIS